MNINALKNEVNKAYMLENEYAVNKAERYAMVGEEILVLEASCEKVKEAKKEILTSFEKQAPEQVLTYLKANYSQFKSVARTTRWLMCNRAELAGELSCESLIELDHLLNTAGGGEKALELTKNNKKPSVRTIRETKKSLKPEKSGKIDRTTIETNLKTLMRLVLECKELIENSEEECACALADWMIDHSSKWNETEEA